MLVPDVLRAHKLAEAKLLQCRLPCARRSQRCVGALRMRLFVGAHGDRAGTHRRDQLAQQDHRVAQSQSLVVRAIALQHAALRLHEPLDGGHAALGVVCAHGTQVRIHLRLAPAARPREGAACRLRKQLLNSSALQHPERHGDPGRQRRRSRRCDRLRSRATPQPLNLLRAEHGGREGRRGSR